MFQRVCCASFMCVFILFLKNKDTGEPSGTFGRDLDLFRRRPMSWKDRCHWLVRYGSQINMAAASNIVLFYFFFNIKVDGTEIFSHCFSTFGAQFFYLKKKKRNFFGVWFVAVLLIWFLRCNDLWDVIYEIIKWGWSAIWSIADRFSIKIGSHWFFSSSPLGGTCNCVSAFQSAQVC